ncbi:hypothetical protein [Henriciella sp.]|uniref:hypothetical protein n=1 Tax=Henriciella sp. TaxID=1968823 RepID=UPI002622B7BF|nr:hypothetical protein [Henriciella sp.]
MKTVTGMAIAGLFMLGGCESWQRPYVDNSAACDDIVDSKDRLDCYERARQAEADWREEKRREKDDREED